MNRVSPGRRRDVIIIGAGPAGSSSAAGLAALGWDVLLIEQHRLPHHKVCGEFLSPESQTSLQALGLYDAVKALAPAPMETAKLVSRLGLTVRVELPGCAWGVSRYGLDAALAAAAARTGAELWTGVTVTAIHNTGSGWQVEFRSKQGVGQQAARAVIAACGRYSRPGLPPHLPAGPKGESYVGVKRHYEGIAMPAQVELYLFPGGYVGIGPVEGNRVNVCLLARQSAFERGGKQVGILLEAVSRWNPAAGRRLAGGQALPATEAAVAPVDPYRRPAPWDGVVCLGDTAVMIPPLTGDGMAMALRSAELCAPLAHDFLAGRLSLAGWEAAYRQAWQDEFDRRVKVGRWLQALLEMPVMADAWIGLAGLVPPLADLLVRTTRGRLRPVAAPGASPSALMAQARVQGVAQTITQKVEGQDHQENCQAGQN